MNEHTPKPWEISPAPRGGFDIMAQMGPVKGIVASMRPEIIDSRGDRTIANSHLIVAAPELLDALKDMLNPIYQSKGKADFIRIEQARAAIAKAEGRK